MEKKEISLIAIISFPWQHSSFVKIMLFSSGDKVKIIFELLPFILIIFEIFIPFFNNFIFLLISVSSKISFSSLPSLLVLI